MINFSEYWNLFLQSFKDYWGYISYEIMHPGWSNYFYWLIGISLFYWMIEIIVPWRKKQSIIRKDFYLDAFYMFFNFFIFSLIGFYALSNVVSKLFEDFLSIWGIKNIVAISVNEFPVWLQLLTLFLIRDFIHFNVHRLLHRIPFLWEFHKVHHSVKEMGFAAHLRYHWMENIVYRVLEYIPMAMIGFGIDDFLIVHLFAIAIGHSNHTNYFLPLGPLKYVFNNPQMHIWHHAKTLPNKYGVNFGISLSIWDYIYKSAYIPQDGKDVELGFEGDEEFPDNFVMQALYPASVKK